MTQSHVTLHDTGMIYDGRHTHLQKRRRVFTPPPP